MTLRKYHTHKALLALGDTVALTVGLWWALCLHDGCWTLLFLSLVPLVLGWGFGAQVCGLYKVNIFRRLHPQVFLLAFIALAVVGTFAAILLVWSPRTLTEHPLAFVRAFVLVFALTAAWRVAVFTPLYTLLRRVARFRRRAIVVGTGPVAVRFTTAVSSDRGLGIDVVGFVTDLPQAPRDANGSSILGDLIDLPRIVRDDSIDEVIIALPDGDPEQVFACADVACATGIRVSIHSNLLAVVSERRFSEEYAGGSVLTVRNRPAPAVTRVFKRTLDLTLGTLAFIIALPLWAVCAIAIKATSRGPILFVQERIGRDEKPFMCYKFRTMFADGDESVHEKYMEKVIVEGKGEDGGFKMKHDPRVTKAGKWLRPSSLDELPQLINVLKGEMSLVGPRPPIPYEVSLYKDWQKRRLRGRPGITGFWQVVGRSEVPFDDICALDIFYIENMSPWLDLEILARTVHVVLGGRGAR
jgi:exopolysaccharide biosynthesis polyprenyl glycosylphosphotransferase